MKKSLLALAVLGAFATAASAQSTVTLSGIFKQGIAQQKVSGPGLTPGNKTSGLAVVDGSSRIIFSGSEDLGGGLRANFQMDNRFRPDEGAGTLAGGNTFVGLSGGFGAVQIGRLDSHYCQGGDSHGTRATALQASSCGIMGFVQDASIANASRSTNMIRYTSPNFSGFQGAVGYSTAPFGSEANPGSSSTDGQALHAQLTYSSGPIRAGFSYWDAETEGGGSFFGVPVTTQIEQKAYTLWGGYDLGIVNIGLAYDQSKISTVGADVKRGAFTIPVSAPVGPGTVLFTYTQARDSKVNGTSVNDSGAKLISIGYEYPLSRRTSLGISYAKMNNDANANYNLYTSGALGNLAPAAAGQDQQQFYLGVRHTF